MIGATHEFSIKRVLGLIAGLAGVATLMGFDANGRTGIKCARLCAWPAHRRSQAFPATASIVALAALCTAFAFTMLFMLTNEVGAARATLVANINPAFAVLLGVLVFDRAGRAACS